MIPIWQMDAVLKISSQLQFSDILSDYSVIWSEEAELHADMGYIGLRCHILKIQDGRRPSF